MGRALSEGKPHPPHRDSIKRPYIIGDASGHRGRDPQTLVDSGEIVVHEVKRQQRQQTGQSEDGELKPEHEFLLQERPVYLG